VEASAVTCCRYSKCRTSSSQEAGEDQARRRYNRRTSINSNRTVAMQTPKWKAIELGPNLSDSCSNSVVFNKLDRTHNSSGASLAQKSRVSESESGCGGDWFESISWHVVHVSLNVCRKGHENTKESGK